MRAFSPASSKVDLVEAAEAHARQLDQLALNLTRCEAREAPRALARSSLGHGESGRALGEAAVSHKVWAKALTPTGHKLLGGHTWQGAGTG